MSRLLYVAILAISLPFQAVLAEKNHASPYTGQEQREIKSLSADDIEQLRQGAGWGLAKAAELNGMPGPRHLLDAAEELGLSEQQIASINTIYEAMNARAIEAGAALIEQERKLERLFQSRQIDETSLRQSLEAIAAARMELRYTHLMAHLETSPLLSTEQIEAYNELRGYGSQDPCAAVPDGHDPTMWRKHNGCE